MTRRTAFFHVGMPKTGTTAIQHSFAASRDQIRANGLLYPGKTFDHADMLPLFHQKGVHHYYYTNRGIAPLDALATGEAVRAEIAAEISAFDGDVVLSTEYFFDLHSIFIENLRAFFVERDFQFRVILYVRHPVSAAVSHANQDIKMSFRTLKECVENPPYHPIRSTLEEYSVLDRDELILRDYEAVPNHDCVQDILDACAYRGDRDQLTMVRSNVSLTMAGAILADAYTRLKFFEPETNTRRTYMFRVGGPKFALPESSLEKVRRDSADEVAWVAQHFGITLKEGVRTGSYSPTLSDEAVLDLVRYISTLKQPPK